MKHLAKTLTMAVCLLGMAHCSIQMYYESTTRQSTFVFVMFSLLFILFILLLYVLREEDLKDKDN